MVKKTTQTVEKTDEVQDVKTEKKVETPKTDIPAKTEKTVIEKTVPAEVKKTNDDFDKKLSGDDTPAGEEVISDEGKPEKTDKVADGKDTGKEKDEVEDVEQEPEVISDELAERAEKVGLTVEQIENFSSVEDLENTLNILEARQEKVVPEKKSEEKPPETKVDEDKPYDCGLDPEKYDEGVIKAVNKLGDTLITRNKKLEAEIATLKGETTEIMSRHQQEAQDKATSWLDDKITELGEDFEDVFGKGTINDIKTENRNYKKNPHFIARGDLDNMMFTTAKVYEATGKPIPKKDKLFEMALNNLHPEKIKQKVLKPTETKLKLRAGQVIGRGSGKASPMTAIDAAKQKNKEFDVKHLA